MINVAIVRLRDQFENGPRYTTEEVRGWVGMEFKTNYIGFLFAGGDTVWYNNKYVVEFSTTQDEK